MVHNIDTTQRKLDARIEIRSIVASKVGDPSLSSTKVVLHKTNLCESYEIRK